MRTEQSIGERCLGGQAKGCRVIGAGLSSHKPRIAPYYRSGDYYQSVVTRQQANDEIRWTHTTSE